MESRMIKIAGRCAAFAAACLALCSAQAANRYWTGAGGDNEWTNKLNWSGSAWPGPSDTAIFTNDAPLGVRLNPVTDYQDRCAQNLKFLGKDVAFGSDGYANKVLYFFGSPTTTIEVVSGTTVTMSKRMYRYNANRKVENTIRTIKEFRLVVLTVGPVGPDSMDDIFRFQLETGRNHS